MECLKKYGQRLDCEIASEIGVSVASVRRDIVSLAASGAVITCNLTRYENGKHLEALVCRVAGFIPAAAPGRKAKPATT
jgi:predicted ArsR family transcriptional regulator